MPFWKLSYYIIIISRSVLAIDHVFFEGDSIFLPSLPSRVWFNKYLLNKYYCCCSYFNWILSWATTMCSMSNKDSKVCKILLLHPLNSGLMRETDVWSVNDMKRHNRKREEHKYIWPGRKKCFTPSLVQELFFFPSNFNYIEKKYLLRSLMFLPIWWITRMW